MDADQRLRDEARAIFLRALQAATVGEAVARQMTCGDRVLAVGELRFELGRFSEVCVVALGKAGATMFDAVEALLPVELKRTAVVSSPQEPLRMRDEIAYFAGGHPEPNEQSFAAARAALDAVSGCAEDALVIFLISGGASAMCELPIDAEVSLEDSVALNRLLVGSGASIAEVNCVRKHLSRVKGGRLAAAAGLREKLTLLVSDVPAEALDALGSGPSLPDGTSAADCVEVLRSYRLMERLPASVRRYVGSGVKESPARDHAAFANASVAVLLDNAEVLAQAERVARELGYEVEVDCSCDDWDYARAAAYLLERLAGISRAGRKVCLLSGGEVTVRLPEKAGVGGRNLQFALHCAALGVPDGCVVLSAGTDGVDGSSSAAGAVVDATTRTRGEALGLSLKRSLAAFDAYPYFERIGDAVVTGPTGNNLRDVRILLSDRCER